MFCYAQLLPPPFFSFALLACLTKSSLYVSCSKVFAKPNSNCRCRVVAVAAYVLLLCCSCCSCCCCSLTALKCARIKIKLPAIKAEKVNTLPRPVPPLRRVLLGQKTLYLPARYSYINCTICHTSAWRHLARLKLLLTCHDSIYEVYEVAAYLQERERERGKIKS